MPTPQTIPIKGVNDTSGKLVRARVYNADGTTAGSFALGENQNNNSIGLGTFNGVGSITFAGVDGWVSAEAREVATQDDAGFNTATLVLSGPSIIGYVKAGVLLSDPNLDGPISSVGSGGVNVGGINVDWNYNGTDMRVLRQALGNVLVGIGGVKVEAYILSEYNSNPATAVLRGFAISNDLGQWFGMRLTSGVMYTIRVNLTDGSPTEFTTLTV